MLVAESSQQTTWAVGSRQQVGSRKLTEVLSCSSFAVIDSGIAIILVHFDVDEKLIQPKKNDRVGVV